MNISNLSLLISLSLFTLVFMIYQNISQDLTAKSYIAATYMYIFFAFLLIILINEEKLVPDLRHSVKFMALAFLMIILTVILHFIPKENQLLKHVVWFGLIVIMGIILNPVYEIAKNENILNKVLLTISVMFIVMTYFAYTKPLSYFDSWYPYLYSGLIGLIVSRLSNIIFSDLDNPSGFYSRDFLISIVSVLIFNGFLAYDTQKIVKDGVKLNSVCQGKNNLECADYPTKSLDIILDMLNLFVNTTSVYRRK